MPGLGRFFGGTDRQSESAAELAALLEKEPLAQLAVRKAAGTQVVALNSSHGYWSMAAAQVDLTKGPIDLTGNGNTMVLGAALPAATCWANAGYATTAATNTVNGHLATPNQPNFATDLIVFSFVINMATPAGLVFIAGGCDYNAAQTGLMLSAANPAGAFRAYLAGNGTLTGGGGLPILPGTNPIIADGTDHKVFGIWEPKMRALYIWVDGVLCVSIQNALAPFASVAAGAWTQPWAIGTHKIGTPVQLMKVKNVSFGVKADGILPSNLNAVATAYAATPQDVFALMTNARRRVRVPVIGQSNQHGFGGTAGGVNAGAGVPVADPMYPNGVAGKRSLWTTFVQTLGASGYAADILNTAVGSTSLMESWAGRVRDYAPGSITVKLGSFVAQGGRIYKASAASHNVSTGVTAPVLTNGLVDGAITWVDVGSDTGFRGVAAPGSKYWDPNSLVAACIATFAQPYDGLTMPHIAAGETDAELQPTRAEYRSALVNIAGALIAAGANGVMLGHTFGTAARVTAFDTLLLPALADTVATGGKIFAGGNLYKAFGVLPANPASGIGFIADGLHGNDPAYVQGGVVAGNDALKWLASQP
jgi:hypothetical protein